VKPKQSSSPAESPKSLLTLDVVQITHQKGHWTLGPLRTGERSKISFFRGEAQRGLQANHQRITNRAYVMKNRLVFRQTSKETVEALAREGPVRARTSPGCPRLAGKPRTSSLVVDRWMNSMEVEGEEG
jgi:hypothetical protein